MPRDRWIPAFLLALLLQTFSVSFDAVSGLQWFYFIPWFCALSRAPLWASWLMGLATAAIGGTRGFYAHFPALYLTLTLYISVTWPLVAAAVRRLRSAFAIPFALSAPAAWVSLEHLRTHAGFLAFPYLMQPGWGGPLSLRQVADLGGVPAVSFLVLMVNGALADLWLGGRKAVLPALGTAVLFTAAWIYGEYRLHSLPVSEGPRTVVVQGLATLAEKGQTGQRALAIARGKSPGNLGWDASQVLLTRHHKLTLGALQAAPADLVCWPEGVIISALPQDPEFLAEIRASCRDFHAPLLVGAIRISPEARQYDSAFLWGTDGECLGVYDKAYPAPFAEGIPQSGPPALWRRLARLIGRRLDKPLDNGPPEQAPLLLPTAAGPCPFGASLCFDVYHPALFRHWQASGGRFVTLLSFEGHFPPFIARMELAQAGYRAIEMRRSVVRCSENGWSAVIGPTGASVAEAGLKAAALTARIPICNAGSFYARHGDLFSGGMLTLTLMGLLAAALKRKGRP